MKKTHILFIIYVCFKCVALNTPKVTIIPQSTAKIQENTVYQFTCSITVQTNWRSVMFFDSTIGSSTVALFFNQNGCLFVPLSSGFQDVYGITCGATLGTFLFTIKKVTEKHNNQTVTCQAQYGTGNDLDIFVSDSVVIMVIIPLTSISISPDTTLRNVKRDSPGPFRCIATSRPLSVILWRKARNGQNIEDLASHEEQINETIVDSYLNYTGNEADEGVDIYCIGQYNGTHIESKRVRLRIIYAPDTGPSIQQIPAGNIITGDNLMLTCTVSGGNPLPILSWNCTGIKTNKTKGSESSYSVAFTVNKANSNMICTCSVFYHPVLSYRPSVHHLLVVFYVPEKVPIIQQMPTGGIISGNKVQLACSTYGGNPLPILSWNCIGTLKNLTTGIMASYSVEFIVDKSDNNKVCSCIATHIISLYNPIIQHTLIVHYAPDTGPSIQQIPAGNIITGDNLMLTCTVSGGNPLPILSWNCTGIKTIKTKGSEASYSVAFSVNKANNNMICTCSVFYHPVLSYRPSVHHLLVVFYVPDNIPIIQQMPTGGIISGNTMQLVCSIYGGNPLPVLSWNCTGTLKNLTTGNTASYSVEFFVDKSDNNKVCSCIATHIISSYNPTIQHTLVVYYKPFLDTARYISPSYITILENYHLFITISVKSNPYPMIKWTFVAQENIDVCNNSAINSTSTTDGLSSSSNISIEHLKRHMFGEYTFTASNVVGIFRRKFSVVEKGQSIFQSFVFVVCKSTTAVVVWKPNLNEGYPEEFYVQYTYKGKNNMSTNRIPRNETRHHMVYTVNGLHPDRKYYFTVLSVSLLGEFSYETVECFTDTDCKNHDFEEVTITNSGMFGAGIATLFVGLVVLIPATGIIIRNCLKTKNVRSSKSDEYTNIQRTNPAFTDEYSTLPSNTDSRPLQENTTKDYEECAITPDVTVYHNIDNMKSDNDKTHTNQGMYANIKA